MISRPVLPYFLRWPRILLKTMNTISEEYTQIGHNLIEELFPELEDVQIAFLSSDVEKKTNRKIVFADCTLVNKARYDWCCPFDFIITVYEPNIIDFNDKQIRILLEHELKHCGVEETKGETKYYIVPHDIEEFRTIIDKYGLDWSDA